MPPVKTGSFDADVIIAGAGLVGATLAALLARHDIKSILIEGRNTDATSERTDPRALAITRASENILHAASAWQCIPEDRIGYFRRMQVWEEQGKGDIEFDSADLCEPTLGFIIEQFVLEQALTKTNTNSDRIKLIQPATLAALDIQDDYASVHLEDGQRLTSRLVIGADGARSRLRTLAGIAYPVHDYQQQAVACAVYTEKPHDETARQRFLATGPLAFLPMADPQQCGVVWSTSPGHAAVLMQVDEHDFNKTLARAFDHVLGDVISSGPRARFPLQHAQAEKYCQPRLVLIGDAAHTVHPLAGQGANLGLLDAATLAEVLIDARNRNKDIGACSVLRRYERWRRGENYMMLRVLQGFKMLFDSRLESVRTLRNIGLDITDMLTPVKHVIMRHAMGLSGDLPLFAQIR